ncbi:hypothetical protein LTR50_006865 [Elasticomyces elasticus]|nr:hypothetical protein LTR50_006865 [Elasticomyces elasticus]
MDGVSLTVPVFYLALSAVQITESIYKLVRAVKDTDSKTDLVYWRLVAEKEATESWAKQTQLTGGSQSIPPDKRQQVEVLIRKLEVYYSKAQKKYARLEPASAKGLNLASLMVKGRFVLMDFAELKEMVDTIHAMNTALRAIAPPLPAYTQARYQEGMAPELVSVLPRRPSHTLLQPPVEPEHDDQPNRAASEEQSTTYFLQTIYTVCLEGLRHLANLRKTELLENAAARLKLWGIGLFEAQFPLDLVLESNGGAGHPVRKGLSEGLATILVLEQRDLFLLGDHSGGSRDIDHSAMRMEISSLLGTDELSSTALKQMMTYLESGTVFATTDNPEMEVSQTEAQFEAAPRIWAGLDESVKTASSISRVVESLYDLLPTIRAEIDFYCYTLELMEENKAATAVLDPANKEKLIEDRLNRAEMIIQQQAKLATEQGRRTEYIGPFKKQRMRMEELCSVPANEPGGEGAPDKRAKQDDLIKILGDFIAKADSLQPTKIGQVSSAAPATKLEKSRLTPEKLPLEKDSDSDEADPLIAGLLSSLKNSL